MPLPLAGWISLILALYLLIGLVYAAVAHARGLDPSDPDVSAGSRGFRVLVTPGLVLLWPILMTGGLGPAPDREPHDRATNSRAPARTFQLAAIVVMLLASALVLTIAWTTRPDFSAPEYSNQR